MYKACSKCGRIHPSNYKCYASREVYSNRQENKLRSTNAWTKKSLEIRERANYLCEVCRDKGIYKYNNVEVHHIIKVKENPTLLLDNYNLITLCKEHHKLADEGKIDANYLRRLATHREGNNPPTD